LTLPALDQMEIEAAAAVAPDQMTVRGITAALAKAAIKAALAADRAAEDIERLCERAQDVAAQLAKVLKDVRS
jgi:hypothetical protein